MNPLICPSCGSSDVNLFYHVAGVPVHSVQIIRSGDEAEKFPVGDIDLGCCRQCGFVSNYSYRPELQDYAVEYESTQSFSGTYNQFAVNLVNHLVDHFELKNRTVIEIGCGQGELLNLLADIGKNNCIGFDPAFENEISLHPSVKVVKDYYSEKYADTEADAVICKMTLEHIYPVREFIQNIRKLFRRADQLLFIQVPNAGKVLGDVAFWDVYYEHCSYFTRTSLVNLLERCGFKVVSAEYGYDEQYLMVVARLGDAQSLQENRDGSDGTALSDRFGQLIGGRLTRWKDFFRDGAKDKTGVLWGGGSKAVAFITTLGLRDEIACVVDVNPRKEHTFLPGSAHQVVLPAHLLQIRPDYVVVMNPIYVPEIRSSLEQLSLFPEIYTVEE